MRPAHIQRTLAAILTFCLASTGCAPPAASPEPASTPLPTSTYTPPPAPTETSTAEPGSSPASACPPPGAAGLEEMRSLENEVAELRGLAPQTPLQRELLDPGELSARVVDDILQEYTEEQASADALLYSLLGWIEPGLDLRQLYSDLMAEQAAGFYDPDTGEMVILCGTGFGGLERLTYAHEYTHALVDQTYDPKSSLGYSVQECQTHSDRCLAAQALLEGDATLLEEQWLRTFGLEQDLVDILAFFDAFEMPVYNSAPAYIQAELTFPYLQGLLFVRSIYLQNGWASVDALYANPPVSSEQILHPDRYPRDLPLQLPVPDLTQTLGTGWTETRRDTFGEWNTYMLLAGQLDSAGAETGAGGWGGDIVLVFRQAQTGAGALVLVTQWDTLRDAREFFDAFRQYETARFGEPSGTSPGEVEWDSDNASSLLLRQSNQTLWILAPEAETRAALRAAVQLPLWPVP